MRNLLISSAMGVTLAVSTPAFAQDNCGWTESVNDYRYNGDGAITNAEAVRRIVASPEGRAALPASQPGCDVVAETLRRNNLVGSGVISRGDSIQVALAIPARPAVAQPPANAVGAPPGGGAMLDAELAEMRRQRDAGVASPEVLTRLSAAEADLASLRAERVQAGRPAVRNTTVVRRETRVVNQGLNQEDRTVLDSWKNAREGITNTFGRLFGTGPDNPETREREDGIIGGLQATDVEHTRKIGVLENLLSWTYWALWTLLPLLLVGLAVFFLARSGLAKKTDHDDTKADATTVADQSKRIDELDARLTDTEQQVGKKIVALAPDLVATVAGMKEGEELTTTVVVESVAHEVGLRKGAGDDVFIVSGVKGHVASNVVKAYNLTRTLRNAAWSDRLNVKASV